MIDKLIAAATLPRLLASLAGMLATMAFVRLWPGGPFQAVTNTLGTTVPELQIGLLPGEPFNSLHAMGEMRERYRNLQFWDLPNFSLAVLTYVMIFAYTGKCFPRLRSGSKAMIVLAFVLLVAEIVENSLLLAMIAAYPETEPATLATIQQIASTTKLGCGFVLNPLALAALVLMIVAPARQ